MYTSWNLEALQNTIVRDILLLVALLCSMFAVTRSIYWEMLEPCVLTLHQCASISAEIEWYYILDILSTNLRTVWIPCFVNIKIIAVYINILIVATCILVIFATANINSHYIIMPTKADQHYCWQCYRTNKKFRNPVHISTITLILNIT